MKTVVNISGFHHLLLIGNHLTRVATSLCEYIYTGLVNCPQLYQLPNIQMQKTGAGADSQSDAACPLLICSVGRARPPLIIWV
jgi:hypothetical protein